MKRTLRPLILALPLWAAACSSATSEGSPPSEFHSSAVQFGAGGAVFPVERGEQLRWLGFEGAVAFWEPSAEDIRSLEGVLRSELEQGAEQPERLSDYAVGRPDYQDWVRDRVHEILARLPDYRRQYIGFESADGSRRIMLSAFPGPAFQDVFEFPRWREELVVVTDGGSRYWSVVYDLEIGTLREFACNGEA